MFLNFLRAVPFAIGLFSGLYLQAQTPTYWLATVERTPTSATYTYDVKAPDYFVAWLLETSERGGGRTATKTINGKTYTFVQQFFSWDTKGSSPASNGQIRLDNKNDRWRSDAWRNHQNLKTDQNLIRALDSAPTQLSINAWREADLMALRWDGTGAPALKYSEKIPEITQLWDKLVRFNEEPTKPGGHFPSVQVPTNLDALRSVMLAYGNAGRRDPDFRKDNGSKTATDLSGPTVNTQDGQKKVFKQNPGPPYFSPHVLNDKLNAAAQFHAEYIASINVSTHDGPSDYRDPVSGKTVDLSKIWLRSEFFGAGRSVVETVAPADGIGDLPHRWMKAETMHFQPWFNVDGCYPEIGFGVARSKQGDWYFVGVPAWDRNCSKAAAPSLSAPVTSLPAPAIQSVASAGFPLPAGTTLNQSRKYRSESGNHYLVFQPDGNLVVYTAANQFVWGLNTVTTKFGEARSVELQADGNLVVRGSNQTYIWSALTRDPDSSAFLTLTAEGALRLVSGKSGVVLWSSR
jgi:hypothetical protein